LFYADDWTLNALGKLDTNIQTPHLDEMVDNGMLFTSNFVTTSICFISRATLLSGVYAAVHNQTRIFWEELYKNVPWNETLFPLMRSVGSYYTGLVGKWHLAGPKTEMDMAFDVRKLYYGKHWVPQRNGAPPRYVTDLNKEDAIRFLQDRPKKHGQQFFLKVSFFATHAVDGTYPSYQPKNTTLNTYYNANTTTIPLPKTATNDHWERLPPFFTERNEGRKRWVRRFEPTYYQESIKALYSMVTEVDEAIGSIIDELKHQGVYNDTLLIFTTDNGNLHGQHGLAEKWYPFEESILVPLIIQDPRMPQSKRGKVSTDFTLSIDLAPTILGAANIVAPTFMQGKDIAQLYLNDNDNDDNDAYDDDGDDGDPATTAKSTKTEVWRKDFFYEYNRGNHTTGEGHDGKNHIDNSFALVTPEWKYIYWRKYIVPLVDGIFWV
jgi:arylsulfatase